MFDAAMEIPCYNFSVRACVCVWGGGGNGTATRVYFISVPHSLYFLCWWRGYVFCYICFGLLLLGTKIYIRHVLLLAFCYNYFSPNKCCTFAFKNGLGKYLWLVMYQL